MPLDTNHKWTLLEIVAALFSVAIALVTNGAVPFVMAPTMGQAVWTAGFAQSFANQGLFDIYAINFGIPRPMPIVFGLSGALPTSWFIRLGLHPIDAYTLMSCCWLLLALYGAYRLARRLTAGRVSALLSGALWLCLPVVWGHTGYSMLSLGIALLPLYLYVVITFLESVLWKTERWTPGALILVGTTVVAVFMDGYTFVMFAVGTGVLTLWFAWNRRREIRARNVVGMILPVVFSFLMAYYLYVSYVGETSFGDYPLEFFRAYGIDVLYPIVPTAGVHWVWDSLGLSQIRDSARLFGDASVWRTTFSLPLIMTTVAFAFLRAKKPVSIILPLTVIAILGWYMSLGPSLKVSSERPPQIGALMPAEYGIGPTGTALLSKNIPGFSSMRAAYRWSALGLVGTWGVYILLGSRFRLKSSKLPGLPIVTVILVLTFLPHPVLHTRTMLSHRSSFFAMERDLLAPLRADIEAGSRVAFIPRRNDFIVNYLAARLQLYSYNVGGDKNIQLAKEAWPNIFGSLSMGQTWLAHEIMTAMLSQDLVDVVVVPKFHSLWAAHRWPYGLHDAELEAHEQLIAVFRQESDFSVTNRSHYALVRGNGSLSRRSIRKTGNHPEGSCLPPDCLVVNSFLGYQYSQVGNVDSGAIETAAKRGYLVYGPYVPMKAGTYQLRLFGVYDRGKEARFDVVSGSGTDTHVSGTIPPALAGGSTVLTSVHVTLDEPIADLEIRVFVGSDDSLRLTGYQFIPAE